jgi:hypothetical protein
MPFGRYRGRPAEDCPPHYLTWLLSSSARLSRPLRQAIEDALAPACGCFGPRWWYAEKATGVPFGTKKEVVTDGQATGDPGATEGRPQDGQGVAAADTPPAAAE